MTKFVERNTAVNIPLCRTRHNHDGAAKNPQFRRGFLVCRVADTLLLQTPLCRVVPWPTSVAASVARFDDSVVDYLSAEVLLQQAFLIRANVSRCRAAIPHECCPIFIGRYRASRGETAVWRRYVDGQTASIHPHCELTRAQTPLQLHLRLLLRHCSIPCPTTHPPK